MKIKGYLVKDCKLIPIEIEDTKKESIDLSKVIGWYTDEQGRRRPIMQRDSSSLERAIIDVSRELKDLSFERVYILDKDGNAIFIRDGDEDSVPFKGEDLFKLKEEFIKDLEELEVVPIHNHPESTTNVVFCNVPSAEDIIQCASFNLVGFKALKFCIVYDSKILEVDISKFVDKYCVLSAKLLVVKQTIKADNFLIMKKIYTEYMEKEGLDINIKGNIEKFNQKLLSNRKLLEEFRESMKKEWGKLLYKNYGIIIKEFDIPED